MNIWISDLHKIEDFFNILFRSRKSAEDFKVDLWFKVIASCFDCLNDEINSKCNLSL